MCRRPKTKNQTLICDPPINVINMIACFRNAAFSAQSFRKRLFRILIFSQSNFVREFRYNHDVFYFCSNFLIVRRGCYLNHFTFFYYFGRGKFNWLYTNSKVQDSYSMRLWRKCSIQSRSIGRPGTSPDVIVKDFQEEWSRESLIKKAQVQEYSIITIFFLFLPQSLYLLKIKGHILFLDDLK